MRRVAIIASVLFLIVAGTLTVAAAGDGEVFNACVNDRSGQLRLVDTESDCRRGESFASWNQTGPQGPVGPAGPAGPAGSTDEEWFFVTMDFGDPPVTIAENGVVSLRFYCASDTEGGKTLKWENSAPSTGWWFGAQIETAQGQPLYPWGTSPSWQELHPDYRWAIDLATGDSLVLSAATRINRFYQFDGDEDGCAAFGSVAGGDFTPQT